jgi:signal transduction histidine kinase
MLECSIDITYLLMFEAILAFQIVYILLQWFYIRRDEYLWYVAYMLGMSLYGLILYELIPDIDLFGGKIINVRDTLDKVIPILSFYFYFRFARAFIGMHECFPQLNTWIIRLEILLLCYVFTDLIWKFIGQQSQSGELLFRLLSCILFIGSLVLIIAFVKKKMRLSYFLVFGATIILLGNFGAMWMMVRQSMGLSVPFDPFLINSVAIIIDLLAFTTGLSYKARESEIAKVNLSQIYSNELIAKIELQNEITEIRQQIAREIHEELGEGMSDISIYSGLAQKELTIEQQFSKDLLGKIRNRSSEMLSTLQDLIWTLSPGNTSGKSLIEKIQQIQREELIPNHIPLVLEYEDALLNIQFKLSFLKTTISVIRKVFNISIVADLRSLVIKIDDNQLIIRMYYSEVKLTDNQMMAISRFIQTHRIEMHETDEHLELIANIPSFRY